jgi:hypothetical protein
MDVKIRREDTTQEDLGVDGRILKLIFRNRMGRRGSQRRALVNTVTNFRDK